MNDEDKWVSVDKRTSKLVIRFKVKGIDKQFYIASGLKDTKKNREIVRLKRDAIINDITLNRFDSTLKSYQFKLTKHIPIIAVSYNLQQLWDKYVIYKESIVERTTIKTNYSSITRYINKLPSLDLKDAAKNRDFLIKSTTPLMAYIILNNLKACCDWAVDSNLITENYFKNLKIKKPKYKSNKDNTYKAFTLEQRDIIIDAFDNHNIYSHYTNIVKFLFWTGCRLGEAFALTWKDISNDCRKINIDKSCNIHRIKKGTKNGKKRVFPISENSKLQKLLIEMRSSCTDDSQLLFTTKRGKRLTSKSLNDVWNGGYSKGDYKQVGVVKGLLQHERIPFYLKPYATRHTFATWAISQGISPDKVAYWIGDEVETVLKFYCDPNATISDCPDF